MIPRYEKKAISEIWSDHNKFQTYLNVELALLKALEGTKVPAGISESIRAKVGINPERIDEIEKVTRHDIIAFCSSITEQLDAEVGKFFHYGVTSSDIIDTSLTIQIKQSLEVVLPAYEKLLSSLKKRALEMKDVATLGRSHGMFAEPMSFGQKILGHYCEFARRYQDLKDFYQTELTAQYSGAVGNYTILDTSVEKKAAEYLGLQVEELSTQVIPRDRIAKMVSIIGLIGSAIERFAVEIRHLHRSDVFELHEGFAKGQKGSSTMPHKKNPISAENLSGMARMLRSHVLIAQENIVLWHERDISHSSTERMYLPDNFGILLYSLERLTSTVDNLVFHNEVIEKKVQENFSYLSSFYLHKLIEQTNITREDLYVVVQQAAFKATEAKDPAAFYASIMEDMQGRGLKVELPKPTFDEIKKIYLKASDDIFARCLEKYPY